MKGKHQNLNVDYRVRSAAKIENIETGESFVVLCYGFSHSDLCTIDMGPEGHSLEARGLVEPQLNMSGGAQLERKLDRRGIDTMKWRGNIFNTAAIKDTYMDMKP